MRSWRTAPVSQIRGMVERKGFLTLLVLSAIPNPVFDLAGIAAGMAKYPCPRFCSLLAGENDQVHCGRFDRFAVSGLAQPLVGLMLLAAGVRWVVSGLTSLTDDSAPASRPPSHIPAAPRYPPYPITWPARRSSAASVSVRGSSIRASAHKASGRRAPVHSR